MQRTPDHLWLLASLRSPAQSYRCTRSRRGGSRTRGSLRSSGRGSRPWRRCTAGRSSPPRRRRPDGRGGGEGGDGRYFLQACSLNYIRRLIKLQNWCRLPKAHERSLTIKRINHDGFLVSPTCSVLLTQQDPQEPWSRTSPMVGHSGHAVRESNSSGIWEGGERSCGISLEANTFFRNVNL